MEDDADSVAFVDWSQACFSNELWWLGIDCTDPFPVRWATAQPAAQAVSLSAEQARALGVRFSSVAASGGLEVGTHARVVFKPDAQYVVALRTRACASRAGVTGADRPPESTAGEFPEPRSLKRAARSRGQLAGAFGAAIARPR
ncbi:hypothetical protein GCM10023063_50000 [Arthrobacter methylotrophus]